MEYLFNAMQRSLLAVAWTALIFLPAYAGEYKGPNLKGQTVTIAGPWLTGDEDNYDAVNAYFEKATGAKVDYAGSDSCLLYTSPSPRD